MAQHTISLQLDDADLAKSYATVNSPQRELGKPVLKELEIEKGIRVLDIGAVAGNDAAQAADQTGETGHVVAIDPLIGRFSQQNARDNLEDVQADAYDLSRFRENKFQAAFSNAVWHWLQDASKAFEEVCSVLEDCARFVLPSHHPSTNFYSRDSRRKLWRKNRTMNTRYPA
jgi:ubiquinone/menaquinone biosynthesis C-methylase UbiE